MNTVFIHEARDSRLQTNGPFRIARLIRWLCGDKPFALFHLCDDFAIVISDVGVPIRIVNFGHRYTRRGILRFRSLTPNSGRHFAGTVEACVEFAVGIVTHDCEIVVLAIRGPSCRHDFTILLQGYGLAAGIAVSYGCSYFTAVVETGVETAI